MKPLADCHIVIVGLGLMGGSLAGALTETGLDVTGVSRREETVRDALARGLIGRGETNPASVLPSADIVVLATPVRRIVEQIEAFGSLLRDGCLLMDLGSTKAQIAEAMRGLPPGIEPLGGHPMCGSERSGLDAADAGLYRGATFILTPIDRTSPEALALGEALAERVGGVPLVLDALRQDRLVATLSHLPYLLACALVQTADATTSADPAAWTIVAGGYRDTSRVAGSDVRMMLDILGTNREAVLESAAVFRERFDRLIDLIDANAEQELETVLTGCRNERGRMFP